MHVQNFGGHGFAFIWSIKKEKLYEIGNAGKPNGGLMTWTGWDSAPGGASYAKV